MGAILTLLGKTFGPMLAEKVAKELSKGRKLDELALSDFMKRADKRKLEVLTALAKAEGYIKRANNAKP